MPWWVGVGLEPGQLPVADGLEGETAQPDDGADDGDRPGRSPLQQASLDREAGQPQDQGLEQVDGPQRVEVLVPLRAVQQVAVARVLWLAAVARANIDGQPQAPDDRGDRERRAAPGLAVPDRADQPDQGDQGDADAPCGVHHAVLAGLQRDRERDSHHDQQRGRRGQQGDGERPGGQAAHRAFRACRTARIWSTPIRPSSKASAPPARYSRQRRICSSLRISLMAGRFCSKFSSQARMVRT